MQGDWIKIAAFASASLLTVGLGALVYEWLLRYHLAVRQRLDSLSDAKTQDVEVSLFKDLQRLRNSDDVESRSWKDWFELELERSGIEAPLWMVCCGWLLVATVVVAAAAYWSWLLSVLLGVLVVVGPIMAVRWRHHRVHRAFTRQLPDAFAMISRAVKSGQTIPAALQIISDDFPPPVCKEFSRCNEQQKLGITREAALRDLAKRNGIMELELFVVALLVQARSGGNLVDLLDSLAGMIRKRLAFAERVRALTSEGRTQALVLLVLPLLAFCGLLVLAPDYVQTLLDRPAVLSATAAAQVVGLLWIRSIVNFEY